jgi:hypothetical protein
MMAWDIIVASSDADQLDELLNGAQEIASRLKPRGTVRIATSVEELKKKRKEGSAAELLILTASLPQHRSSADDENEPGLSFVKELGSGGPACIVVSKRSELYRPIQAIKRCELLLLDSTTNYVEDCLRLAERLGVISEAPVPDPEPPSRIAVNFASSGTPATMVADSGAAPVTAASAVPPKTYALLEVDLPTDPRQARVRLEIHTGGKVIPRDAEPLGLNVAKIEQLMKECQELKSKLSNEKRWKKYSSQWHADYRKLGERLSCLLWGSGRFKEFYHQGSGRAEGNVRIRFNLQRPWFHGFWEAISFESGERRLVMLENTITRRALGAPLSDTPSLDGQIDAEDGTLNILVIKSNVPDLSTPRGPDDWLWTRYWQSFKGTLPELMHLEDEMKVLRDVKRLPKQSKSNKKLQVNVDILPRTPPVAGKPWSLADDVEHRLKNGSRRYDIVHFAGHALFEEGPEPDARGYLVFSGFPDAEAVPIARVATWLASAKVQLVYLSCCRSSAASAALEFARNNVPMAIGFHWDLDDSKAPVFAKQFYQELVNAKLKVCPAINKARLELYNKYQAGDPIWASPVLIAQPLEWIQVEGVLKLAKEERHRAVRRAPRQKPSPPSQPGAEAAA